MQAISIIDAESAHDFAFTAIDGAALPLAKFKGKAVLVMNTASDLKALL